jgi:prepilin-type processing-associated H-X9-DG protein
MQCTNNLKQLGLALLTREDIHHNFPGVGPTTNGTTIEMQPGFFTYLLPFIEQTAVYDKFTALNGNYTSRGIQSITVGMDHYATASISAFLCPSDGSGTQKAEYAPGMMNYRGCLGDYALSRLSAGHCFRGIMGGAMDNNMQSYPPTTLAMITDGTSNTLGFSEHCIGSFNNADRRTGIAYLVSGVFGSITVDLPTGANQSKTDWLIRPDLCRAVVKDGQIPADNQTKPLMRPTTAPLFALSVHGVAWAEGTMLYDVFNTCLPPNSPSCSASTVVDRPSEARGVYPPTSFHSGGVNASYVDGSVRFLSETIDCGDTTAPGSNPTEYKAYLTGASPYGIFGALGTLQGGEAKSL